MKAEQRRARTTANTAEATATTAGTTGTAGATETLAVETTPKKRPVPRGAFGFAKKVVNDFLADDCPSMAAAISYYTVFSLPPLLILTIMFVGTVLDPADVEAALQTQVGRLIGKSGAEAVHTIIQHADRPGRANTFASVFGLVSVLFGATGAFIQIQSALNKAWGVQPDPAKGGIKNFILKRFLSLGMILGIAFLLLVSLSLSAAISAFSHAVGRMLPIVSEILLHALTFTISFAVISVLFAAMFKILPDAKLEWRDVWVGAVATTLLFMLGKYLIGFYLGSSDPGSAFGAAGSLVLILVWIYYSAMILLLGAEFTETWMKRHGEATEPEPGAAHVAEKKTIVREPEATAARD